MPPYRQQVDIESASLIQHIRTILKEVLSHRELNLNSLYLVACHSQQWQASDKCFNVVKLSLLKSKLINIQKLLAVVLAEVSTRDPLINVRSRFVTPLNGIYYHFACYFHIVTKLLNFQQKESIPSAILNRFHLNNYSSKCLLHSILKRPVFMKLDEVVPYKLLTNFLKFGRWSFPPQVSGEVVWPPTLATAGHQEPVVVKTHLKHHSCYLLLSSVRK